MPRENARRWFWFLMLWLVAVPMMVILVFSYHVGILHDVYERMARRSFDSDLWKEAGLTDPPRKTRIRMVDDLLANNPLVGMTRAEIEELLGPSDDDYWLGPARNWTELDPGSSEWLWLEFDENDIVIRTGIVHE